MGRWDLNSNTPAPPANLGALATGFPHLRARCVSGATASRAAFGAEGRNGRIWHSAVTLPPLRAEAWMGELGGGVGVRRPWDIVHVRSTCRTYPSETGAALTHAGALPLSLHECVLYEVRGTTMLQQIPAHTKDTETVEQDTQVSGTQSENSSCDGKKMLIRTRTLEQRSPAR